MRQVQKKFTMLFERLKRNKSNENICWLEYYYPTTIFSSSFWGLFFLSPNKWYMFIFSCDKYTRKKAQSHHNNLVRIAFFFKLSSTLFDTFNNKFVFWAQIFHFSLWTFPFYTPKWSRLVGMSNKSRLNAFGVFSLHIHF